MNNSVLVQIVGAKVACIEGVKDTWREVSTWVAGQLKAHFGDAVQVKYYDLFDVDCPPMPANAQLPLVMIDNEVISRGVKISMPLIRHKIESMIEKQTA